MGKHGPCYHCGVTSTPLWRNGPPDKPVLCNACGSRWRTKGTLANYTPLHSRMDPDDYEDHKACKVKIISINKNKEGKTLNQRHSHENTVVRKVISDQSHCFRKTMDEDTSNRSSSGSAISNSESWQFSSAEASDLTGPAQSAVWDSTVPSRKRTCVGRPKHSSVEKLTKDLYTILHEQQSSYFTGSSEEDLLFETEKPMVSVEIGHGSVLIRHPSSFAREEESEASSLSVDNKHYSLNKMYSNSLSHNPQNNNKNFYFLPPGTQRMKNLAGKEVHQEQVKRDKSDHEKLLVLGNHNSPLCNIDLNDVLNFEEFTCQLTSEEQQQLIKDLPPVDAAECPDSLKKMFDSSQFKENLTFFQQLLAEGIFNNSFSGPKIEDCTTLRRFALFDLSKSKWVEQHNLLKKCRKNSRASIVSDDNSTAFSDIISMKRSRDSQSKQFPGMKTMMNSSKMVAVKSDLGDNEGFCFSPTTLFAVPPDGTSLVAETLNFAEESSDQHLLLDIRPNNSFPQAELLHPSPSFGAHRASTCSSSTQSHMARQ